MRDNTVLIYTVTLVGIALLSYILWNLDYSDNSFEPVATSDFFCGTADLESNTPFDREGRSLFMSNCAACHKLYKRATGPALYGAAEIFPSDSIFHEYIKGQKVLDSLAHNASKNINSFPNLSFEDAKALRTYIGVQ